MAFCPILALPLGKLSPSSPQVSWLPRWPSGKCLNPQPPPGRGAAFSVWEQREQVSHVFWSRNEKKNVLGFLPFFFSGRVRELLKNSKTDSVNKWILSWCLFIKKKCTLKKGKKCTFVLFFCLSESLWAQSVQEVTYGGSRRLLLGWSLADTWFLFLFFSFFGRGLLPISGTLCFV